MQPQAAIAAEPQMWQPQLLPRVVTMRRLFAAQPQILYSTESRVECLKFVVLSTNFNDIL